MNTTSPEQMRLSLRRSIMGKGHTDQAAYNMLSNYSLGSKGVQLSPPQRKFSIVGQKSMFDRLPNVKRTQEQFEYIPAQTQSIEQEKKKTPSRNNDIDEHPINAVRSYKFFEDATLYNKQSQEGLYRGNTILYEASFDKNHHSETPLEKYHRLKQEIEEFVGEMKTLSENGASVKKEASSNSLYAEIFQQSKQIEQKLDNLKSDNNVYLNNENQITSPIETIQRGLSEDLEQQFGKLKKQTSSNKEDSSDKEIDKQNSADSSKLVRLEKRLALLEKTVGLPEEHSVIYSLENGEPKKFASIESTLSGLERKLRLLDLPLLQSLETRVKSISKELDTVSQMEVVSSSAASYNGEKIESLFRKVSKWDELCKQVPLIVSRLQSLKTVHDEALYFAGSVSKLKQQQEEVANLLKGNDNLLEGLNRNFEENLSVIQNNIRIIQERMQVNK